MADDRCPDALDAIARVEPESGKVMEPWEQMDAWLVRKGKELRDELDDHIVAGGDLKEPGYRDQLGQHRMIQRMRSYISGAKPTPPTRRDDGDGVMDERLKTQLTARVQVALTRSLLGELAKRKLSEVALDELALDAAKDVMAAIDRDMRNTAKEANARVKFCPICHASAPAGIRLDHTEWCEYRTAPDGIGINERTRP